MMFDDNSTSIILAVISLFGVIIPSVISLLAVIYAKKSMDASKANAMVLETVHTAVNGLTAERIDREKRLGEAHVAVARSEGAAEERTAGDQRAKDLLAIAVPAKVEVVKITPVDVQHSIPIEIKNPEVLDKAEENPEGFKKPVRD